MLSPLKNFLNIAANKAGIVKQLEAVKACSLWGKIIENIFNEDAAKKSKAIRFRNGTLTVAVLSSTLSQEFNFKQEEIRSEMNKKMGGEKVRKIRFEC